MAEIIPIHKFASFNPVQVRDIIRAFDEACRSLAEQPPSDATRDILAKRITELAQSGEWDCVKLKEAALEHLESESWRYAARRHEG